MNSLLPPPVRRSMASTTASEKVTGSFPCRKSAKAAVLALRKAGYSAREIQVLRGVPSEELERKGLYDVLSKYVRHLANPKRILIRVTSHALARASLPFRNLGAEMAVNRFFHHTPAQAPASHSSSGAAILPVRRWSE